MKTVLILLFLSSIAWAIPEHDRLPPNLKHIQTFDTSEVDAYVKAHPDQKCQIVKEDTSGEKIVREYFCGDVNNGKKFEVIGK